MGNGMTVGGAREFNIPNQQLQNLNGLTIFRINF